MGLVDKLYDWSLFNRLDPIHHSTRVPMKIWTKFSLLDNGTILELSVNPARVQFNQDKRITSDVVRSGKVFYFWSRTPGDKNLDLLSLGVNGTSGSILNRVAVKEYEQKVGEKKVSNPPEGVLNTKHMKWMKLYAMTREAAYPEELEGDFNLAYIEYASPLFPSGKKITFEGHFSNPLQFDEDGERPFLINYNFDFQVYQSNLDIILSQVEKVLVNKD